MTWASMHLLPVVDAVAVEVEDRGVIIVDSELPHPGIASADRGLAARPGVLRHGIEAGPGQVETGRSTVVGDDLRFDPGDQAQRLRIAFETADVLAQGVEDRLPVVAERRVAEVVG
jgi:hypothetical protein